MHRFHGGSLLLLVGLSGCKADHPGKIESSLARYAKHHIFIRNKGEKNPLPNDPDTIAEGKEAFSHYCNVCHGNDGQTSGVPFADHISPPIPSLASPEIQSYTDGQLKWILDNGIAPSGMPGSKGTLSDDEQWAIVAYLRHLPPAGSQGTPDTYTH
jgi:mono/diheme cytochrome c family protein